MRVDVSDRRRRYVVRTRIVRRRLIGAAGSGAGVVALAACGAGRQRGADGGTVVAGPTEIIWSKQLIGPPQDDYWFATWKAASEATGVKVTPLAEPGADYWTKRQAEFAGGTAAVDLMTTNSS